MGNKLSPEILLNIKEVIKIEIDTLQDLLESIDEEFSNAAKLIFNSKGKLIITGMGKSGIIAQKIAATMVSTGTLAIYMHPAEGLHGDLGIVRKGDILLAIGKSGESKELLDILPTVKKLGVKIISITTDKNSSLARNSDFVLMTPVNKEACYLNLAPTSSTTSALVVGDALAISLMKLRNFKTEDFAFYHPGGILGKKLLLKVVDIARTGENNPIIFFDRTINEMLSEITNKRAGAVSVVNKKMHLLGLVTDKDIRNVIEKGENIFNKSIIEIMNSKPTSVYADDKAITALEIMENRKYPFSVLPVLDRKTKKVIGMIHLHDILSKGLKLNY